MPFEKQPVEYNAATLNRALRDLEVRIAKLDGLTYNVDTRDSVNITVQHSAGTITFTSTTFDGTTKSGTIAIA